LHHGGPIEVTVPNRISQKWKAPPLVFQFTPALSIFSFSKPVALETGDPKKSDHGIWFFVVPPIKT